MTGQGTSGTCEVCSLFPTWATDFESSNSIGTGFATRDPNSLDVDDEIDIDGDDEFGEAQFTEGDIVGEFPPPQHIHQSEEDMDVDIGGDDDDETLRELVAQGKVIKREKSEQVEQADNPQLDTAAVDEADKIDLAILAAKNRGDKTSLLGLLQNKIKILVRLVSFHFILPCLTGLLGISFCSHFALPHMYRILHRPDRLHGLLAHMLQGMLAALSGLHEALPYLQADNGGHRSAPRVLVAFLA